MVDKLSDHLGKKRNEIGKRQLEAAGVIELWNEVAEKIMPQKIVKASEPISFKKGTLKIGVSDPGLANLIVLYQGDLLKAMNEALDVEIERLTFQS